MINETNIVIYAILIITLLAALLYFSLSWIFGPVKKLSDGVKLISEGNFNNNIEVNRKDELRNLADSINEMKDNISNMMKSKETLLIDVSHELRSPLTRIKLANEFIEDKNINAKIRDDVKEMELMISELLDTYRMEKGNDKLYKLNFDLINLINKAVAKFDLNSIHVNSQFKEKIISGDERKMETAIHNIIDNAVKYSDGKPIIIEVFENSQRKDLVYVSVKDKGNGIAGEELKKIFEPFYRIDKSRDKKIEGYGLGLSLVKKILDEHNAEIKVNSKPAEGTEFLISIPVSIQNH
ncbi:MAG: HAMP domain-containing histidine kinase [Ignavibacteria bacterium]|nr:HAMP domain-containing histidine kinase [Ignavibacteria bacterium]